MDDKKQEDITVIPPIEIAPQIISHPGSTSEAVEATLNDMTIDFLNSFKNPGHPYHKTMSRSCKAKFFDYIIARHGHGNQAVMASVDINKKGYCSSIKVYE